MLPRVFPKWPFIKFWNYKSGIYDTGYSYHVTYLQVKDETFELHATVRCSLSKGSLIIKSSYEQSKKTNYYSCVKQNEQTPIS